jgi:hypothetical protein
MIWFVFFGSLFYRGNYKLRKTSSEIVALGGQLCLGNNKFVNALVNVDEQKEEYLKEEKEKKTNWEREKKVLL